MDSLATLAAFWKSFDIPAYDETSVPDNAPLPRITFSTSMSAFGDPVLLNASIWYRSTSWGDITVKMYEIFNRLGPGGEMLDCDGGYLWLKRGTPFAQRIADEDSAMRRYLLNVEVDYLTAD